MTWIGEVLHIAWKDAREARWFLLGYFGAVLAAAANSLTLLRMANGPLLRTAYVAAYVVAMAGMLAVPVLAQADSPSRVDSFWAGRPIRATALVAAKALTILLAVVVPAAGAEMVCLAAYGEPLRLLSSRALSPALFYAVLLAFGYLVSLLTEDLRGFVVALLGTVLGYLLVIMPIADALTGAHAWLRPLRAALTDAGIACGIAFVVMAYRRHEADGRVRRLGIFALPLILLSVSMGGAPTSRARRRPATDALPTPSLSVGLADDGALDPQGRVSVSFDVRQVSAGQRARFTIDSLLLRGRSGSTVVALGEQSRSMEVHSTQPFALGNVRWRIAGRSERSGNGLVTSIPLSAGQRSVLKDGVQAIRVYGRLDLDRPVEWGTMPAQPGAVASHEGGRIRVVSVENGDGTPRLQLVAYSATNDPSTPLFFDSRASGLSARFALFNEHLGEAISLGIGDAGFTAFSLVLPGASAYRMDATLAAPRNPFDTTLREVDDAWLRDARLVVARWEPVATYTMHADARATPPSNAGIPAAGTPARRP